MPSSSEPTAVSAWRNPLTRALREGRVCVGACSLSLGSAATAHVFARSGFSWYYIDMEHSQLADDDIATISLASKLAGIVPIAGPASVADHLVARPLDAGAMGVIAPHVETPEQAADIVRWSRFPPVGERGVVSRNLANLFDRSGAAAWVESQNQEVLVAVKVESVRGIENIDAIAATPGLNAILIGPGDLSTSMGIPGETGHADVEDAIRKMLAAVKRHGIAGGPHVGTSGADVARWADEGATFMSMASDYAMLMDAATASASEARELLGDRML